MKKLIPITNKRTKMAMFTNIFLGGVTMYSIYKDMETVATTAIAGVLTITTMYIGGDSYRSSNSIEQQEEIN